MGNVAFVLMSDQSCSIENKLVDPVNVPETTDLHKAVLAKNDDQLRQLLVDGHTINPVD
jgi:hypothetical protein